MGQPEKGSDLHLLCPTFPVLVDAGSDIQFIRHLGLGKTPGKPNFLDLMINTLDPALDFVVHAAIVLYLCGTKNDITISYYVDYDSGGFRLKGKGFNDDSEQKRNIEGFGFPFE